MRSKEFWTAIADRFEEQAKQAQAGRGGSKYEVDDYRLIAKIYRKAASGDELSVQRAEEIEADRFKWNGPIKGLEHLWQSDTHRKPRKRRVAP